MLNGMQTEMRLGRDFGIVGGVEVELVDPKSGLVAARKKVRNNTTTNMRAAIANSLAALTTGIPDYIAVGKGADIDYGTANQDNSLTLGASSVNMVAQPMVSVTAPISTILIRMQRTGTISATMTVKLWTSSAGAPNTLRGTSDAVDVGTLNTGSDKWIAFKFATPVTATDALFFTLEASGGYTYSAGVTELIIKTDASSAPSPMLTSTNSGSSWSAGTHQAIHRVLSIPDVTKTAIRGEVTRKQVSSKSVRSNYTTRMLASFGSTEGNDYIGDVGLYDAASSGNLLAIAHLDFLKTSNFIMNVYWTILISAAA